MDLPTGSIDVDQQHFAVPRLGEGSRQAGREGGRTGTFLETSYSDEFRFMGDTLQLEVQSKTVPNCFGITPDKMSSIPRCATWLPLLRTIMTIAMFPWQSASTIG